MSPLWARPAHLEQLCSWITWSTVEAGQPLAPRAAPGGAESLQAVVGRDLKLPALGGEASMVGALDRASPGERAQRLLCVRDEE